MTRWRESEFLKTGKEMLLMLHKWGLASVSLSNLLKYNSGYGAYVYSYWFQVLMLHRELWRRKSLGLLCLSLQISSKNTSMICLFCCQFYYVVRIFTQIRLINEWQLFEIIMCNLCFLLVFCIMGACVSAFFRHYIVVIAKALCSEHHVEWWVILYKLIY